MNIEGRNPVLETLRSDKSKFIREIYIKDHVKKEEKLFEIIKLAKKYKIKVRFVRQEFLNKISETGKHQSVIAIRGELPILSLKDIFEEKTQANEDVFLIYVREAFNEYNIGSIIRTAECAGATAVVLAPKTKVSPQVIRAAMGASEHVQIIHESIFNAIKMCKSYGVSSVAVEIDGEKLHFEENLTGSVMLIIGGEDRSLSTEVASKCDKSVKIPLIGKVNSLNMAVAAGVVMYEKLRQEMES